MKPFITRSRWRRKREGLSKGSILKIVRTHFAAKPQNEGTKKSAATGAAICVFLVRPKSELVDGARIELATSPM